MCQRKNSLSGCALAWMMFAAGPLQAATLTVANTDDGGVGSLREAIADALSGDTIDFSVTGTIVLTSGELVIGKDLMIGGPGASSLAISGNNASRVFEIDAGTTVAISGLTIQNGNGGYDLGAGILNYGATLTLTDCTVSGNSNAYHGGGIFNYGGTLVLANSMVSGNYAGDGGGIYNAGVLAVSDSTVSGNTSGELGGGILNWDGQTATVVSSTLSDNSAANQGGGIWNAGTLTVTNTTVSGNTACCGGGVGSGGGILNHGALTLTGSTLSGNSSFYGGGIWNFGNATVKNAVVANSPSGGNCSSGGGGGHVASQGHNLSDDATCSSLGFLSQPSDLNNVPAGLDSSGLQDNGGPTRTIALSAMSPAVDAIPASECTDTTTDQRGVARPQGSGCDIGAFELAPYAADADGDGVPDSLDQCPETDIGAVVNGLGCAIADLCPCLHAAGGTPWKNHGAYVSCVACASRDFVAQGLLAVTDRDMLMSPAAESTCGKE